MLVPTPARSHLRPQSFHCEHEHVESARTQCISRFRRRPRRGAVEMLDDDPPIGDGQRMNALTIASIAPSVNSSQKCDFQ